MAPAAGDDGVQALQDRLGAEVGGDLRAAVGVAVQRRPWSWRESRSRRARTAVGAARRPRVRAGGRHGVAGCGVRMCSSVEGVRRRAACAGVASSPASVRKRDGPPVARPPRGGGVGEHAAGPWRGWRRRRTAAAPPRGLRGRRLCSERHGRQQLLLAAEQQHELRLGALGAVDGGDGDAAVLAGSDLLRRAGRRRVRGTPVSRGGGADLVGVGLGGAAERAQVLEHAFAVAALRRFGERSRRCW